MYILKTFIYYYFIIIKVIVISILYTLFFNFSIITSCVCVHPYYDMDLEVRGQLSVALSWGGSQVVRRGRK